MNGKVYSLTETVMTKYQIGDIVAATTTIYPKWWQFRRAPVTVPAAYICIVSGNS
jgi:hypothetical protein